jgi:hypothetical protein
MAISDFFSLNSGDFGAFFCTKIFYMSCTGLLEQKFTQKEKEEH